ncbi:protein translocase SEC61 complex subunit gamma [Candidatus Woesearchaeota archaeon]|jgi:protein transport protein SEC61 subunit gamma-like protein|nr:protein translocase SEC61 complex subunit gamma [Candidatus Woesearchaeota archaeon]|tara:strand:- start:55 stop:345 length:291 start_codon:yes stop_codon:yes gene_type:complete
MEEAPEEKPESKEEKAESEEPKKVEQPSEPKPSISQRIRAGIRFLKSYWNECKRVLKVTKKPDKESFTMIVKVSGAGMAIIGVIGFVIHMLHQLLF